MLGLLRALKEAPNLILIKLELLITNEPSVYILKLFESGHSLKLLFS